MAIRARVESREPSDIPAVLQDNKNAIAFYRVLKPHFVVPGSTLEYTKITQIRARNIAVASDTAVAFDDIFRRHWKVRFWEDFDVIKQVMNDIDDYLYDEVQDRRGI